MKRFVRVSALLIALTLISVSPSYSQTSESSIGSKDRAELTTLCERSVEEVKASRQVISAYEQQLANYEDVIVKLEKVVIASDEQITLLKIEAAQVRTSLAKERQALVFKESEVQEYKSALAKMTKKKNFFKSMTKVLTVSTGIFAAVAALVILKE